MRKSILIFSIFWVYSLCSYAQITINSEPSGAKVYQDGEFIGTTPCKTTVKQKLVYDIDANKVRNPNEPPYSFPFTIMMDGYETATVYFEGKYEYHQSGFRGQNKYYVVQPKTYKLFAALKKDQSTVITPVQTTAPAPQPIAIQESKPDIRWHFDSDPDGARIYWKVKSTVPNEVKSTESLYLGTTPFNELKPFNIKGLNSDNAKKVTIEVELVKKGYIKQVKTFSAESLTEQQEISWFFELLEDKPVIIEKPVTDSISEAEEELIEDD